jgi:hypothetical protein
VQSVLTDSLEKVLGGEPPRPATPIDGVHASGFLDEVLSVQLAVRLDEHETMGERWLRLSGSAAHLAQVHAVRRVPVSHPAPEGADEHYLVTAPGEYPDVLEPLREDTVLLVPGRWEALWVDVRATSEADAGDHDLTITLAGAGGTVLAERTAQLRILPHRLPLLTLTNTHWFHADSLSTHYEVEVLSEEHWELIRTFLSSAREMDVNSVLTPTWTPPLDTAEVSTRQIVQLVGIRDEGGAYALDFTRLDRWLGICEELGFTGIEVAHLFTQWGARATPAIEVITADGPELRFGWHVPATDPEYRRLLETLIPALRAHLEEHWAGRVLWHISDEPGAGHLEHYRAAKAQVEDLLLGAEVVDALSSLVFAEQGVVDTPIVATDHVGPFLEAGHRPWVYYCVAQGRDVANRFIALPSVRSRVLGRQLFAFGAPGFLHWGFNFWFAQLAVRPIDPFEDTCAGGPFFGGDAFAVYPGPDGSAWPSLRHRVLAQAMADHRALTWLAELTDHGTARALIDEGGTLTYSSFSYDVEEHLRARRAVDARILEALAA